MSTLIGRRLAYLLREKGMSQKDLAEAASLTPAAVSRYVSGAREPRPITIATIAEVLGVKPSDITGTEAEMKTDEAVKLIARNASALTEAQRAELISALAKR